MDLLILRLIHIGFGAFWVGAVFTNVLFLQPTATAIGPDAGRYQLHLMGRLRFPTVILVSATITVGAGIWLLWITTSGLDPDLLLAPSRLGFTVGGVAAILTFAVGSLYVYPRVRRVVRVMDAIMADGRPPSPEEAAQLAVTRRELLVAGWVTVAGLAVATLAMATARQWGILL